MRKGRTRDERIVAAYAAGDLTAAEIGAEFGCGERVVLRAVAAARARGVSLEIKRDKRHGAYRSWFRSS